MIQIQIGYRRGWANLTTREILTHAVYKITAINGQKTAGDGNIYGFSLKSMAGGETVPDVDSLVFRGSDQKLKQDLVGQVNFTWCPTLLDLSDAHGNLFFDTFEQRSRTVKFTGVGCNCYTPMVAAVEAVYNAIQPNRWEDHESPFVLTDLDRVKTFLLGQNYGMGTTITNDMLATGAALIGALAVSAFAIYSLAKKG